MAETTTLATALPHVLPACPHARIALFAIRRMGAHGLADARAAHTLLGVRRVDGVLASAAAVSAAFADEGRPISF